MKISKYYLSGELKGQKRLLIGNLPGSPDNLKLNDRGQLWVALPVFLTETTHRLSQNMMLRNFLSKIPEYVKVNYLLKSPYAGGVLIDVASESIVTILGTNQT